MSEFLAGVCFLIDNNKSETTWTFLFIYVLKKQDWGCVGYVCADDSMFGSKQKTLVWELRWLRGAWIALVKIIQWFNDELRGEYDLAGTYGERRGAYRFLVGETEEKKPLGRPRRRWEDNIKMDIQEVPCSMEGVIWSCCVARVRIMNVY